MMVWTPPRSEPSTDLTVCPIAASCDAEELVERRLEIERIRNLVVTEPRHVRGGLDVGVEIEHVHQVLGVSLGLHVPAHERDRHERRAVVRDEPRHQRVERALLRRDRIGTLRIESKERAAIVR